MLELTCGASRAMVVPELGAGLAGLWCRDTPVLRPCADPGVAGSFDLALNILAPFSNRIDHGFIFGGVRHAIPPNLSGERYPIHGDAFQRVWEVEAATEHMAILRLETGEIGPFRYSARLSYQLRRDGLSVGLELLNLGTVTLPFGCGFHPWFPRSPETRLAFNAGGYWPEDRHHLPATTTPMPLPDELTFDLPRALPDRWINAGFADWPGDATIFQGRDAVSVKLMASGLTTAILYSPDREAGFFCFEPVSHPVNAHNLPGQPGLAAVAPGHSLGCAITLDWG